MNKITQSAWFFFSFFSLLFLICFFFHWWFRHFFFSILFVRHFFFRHFLYIRHLAPNLYLHISVFILYINIGRKAIKPTYITIYEYSRIIPQKTLNSLCMFIFYCNYHYLSDIGVPMHVRCALDDGLLGHWGITVTGHIDDSLGVVSGSWYFGKFLWYSLK